jgi:putative hydrolase of the HAD superfamily
MPLRGVLFDLDDTLFDHEHATLTALTVLRSEEPAFGEWTHDELVARHGIVLEELHHEVLNGQRSIEAARAERFRRLFEAASGSSAPEGRAMALAWRYRSAYEAAWRPVAGAAELLKALRDAGLRIGIVTNNLVAEQKQKLQQCELDPYVDALVTSEDVGVPKPQPQIFGAALERLGVDSSDAVMVGDAWSTDIAGALASGIRPVWFNWRAAPSPDPTVAELRALGPTPAVVRVIAGA